MAELFDSHVHLDFEAFDPHRAWIIERAAQASVRKMFVPGCFPDQWRKLSRLMDSGWDTDVEKQRLRLRVGVGLHPYFIDRVAVSQDDKMDALLADIDRQINELGAVAVGEIGLDKNKGGPRAVQVRVLEAQLSLARERCLPVVLHQVGLQREFLSALKRVGLSEAGGVVHGFSGDIGWAKALGRWGLRLGVGAGILHPARDRLRATVSQLGLDRIVVETDAPDGRRLSDSSELSFNEPRDVEQVVRGLAKMKDASFDVVAETTFRNASDLFGF